MLSKAKSQADIFNITDVQLSERYKVSLAASPGLVNIECCARLGYSREAPEEKRRGAERSRGRRDGNSGQC